MKNSLLSLIIIIALTACAHSRPDHKHDTIPYPTADLQHQIDQLSIEITRLQNRIEELEKRTPSTSVTKPTRSSTRTTKLNSNNPSTNQPTTQTITKQAQTLFQQKQYQRVINHINQHESSPLSAHHLYLLIQSHYQLNNCQSVIDLSQRYLSRFRTHAQAPNVMHQIGWCQWKMQQKDIARDTWRQLIRTYPHSKIADKARADLKK